MMVLIKMRGWLNVMAPICHVRNAKRTDIEFGCTTFGFNTFREKINNQAIVVQFT